MSSRRPSESATPVSRRTSAIRSARLAIYPIDSCVQSRAELFIPPLGGRGVRKAEDISDRPPLDSRPPDHTEEPDFKPVEVQAKRSEHDQGGPEIDRSRLRRTGRRDVADPYDHLLNGLRVPKTSSMVGDLQVLQNN